MSKVFIVIIIMLGLSCSKESIAVSYDEASKKFITEVQKEASAGSIILNKGDNCQVVDGIFVVCGQ